MSRNKGESLTIYAHDSGFLLGRAGGSGGALQEFTSIPTHQMQGNPALTLSRFNTGKKAMMECSLVISSQEFRYLVHKPDPSQKQKAAEQLPAVVKQWVGDDKDDFFFQVLDIETGELVAVESPPSRPMLIAGMRMKSLSQLQQQFLDGLVYPLRLECSMILMMGLVRKLLKANKLKGPVLLVELFEQSGKLVILTADGTPFIRTIDSGERAMCEQVRKELSLKDERSARKLMYSATIDLSDIARQVVSPVMKEIASIVGLYEVETGQTISELIVSNLWPSHGWVVEMLAKDLGMELVRLDLASVCKELGLELDPGLEWETGDNRILPLLAAMGTL
jgi:hypothetical protein